MLYMESGVLGLSGVSSEFRELHAAAGQGHRRAALALDVFCYGVRKMIAGYAAAMGGVDTIVFTAGVGENTPGVRKGICENMQYLGLEIDEEKNAEKNNGEIRDITGKNSKVKVLIIPTNEELAIARDTLELPRK